MAYVSLYRKYRPQNFTEIVGQDHVTRALVNAIDEDRLHHAYLFAGPRGTGKTSTARILAKAVNCVDGPTSDPCNECDQCVAITEGTSVDVIELDMASHGGVDDARELRDRARFAPAGGRRKVYILDEVHMASTAAFNALLKVIEEPPEHVLFTMATTDPQKVLPTIMSRVQRLDLRRVAAREVAVRVRDLVERESGTIDDQAVDAVVRAGDGSVRDTESVLEQVLSYADGGNVTGPDVVAVLGQTPFEATASVAAAVTSGDLADAYSQVQDLLDAGTDLRQFTTDLVTHVRDLLVLVVAPGRDDLVDATAERREALVAQAAGMSREILTTLIDELAVALAEMRQGPARLALEVALARAAVRVGPTTKATTDGAGAATRSAPTTIGASTGAPARGEGGPGDAAGSADRPVANHDTVEAGSQPTDAADLDAEVADDAGPPDRDVDAVPPDHDADVADDADAADDADVGEDDAADADDGEAVPGAATIGDAGDEDEATADSPDDTADAPDGIDEAADAPDGTDHTADAPDTADGTDETADAPEEDDLVGRATARGQQVARDGIAKPSTTRPDGPMVEREAPPEPDEVAQLERIKDNWQAVLELVKADSAKAEAMLKPATPTRLRKRILVLSYPEGNHFHAGEVASGAFDEVFKDAIERAADVQVRIEVHLGGAPVERSRPKGPDSAAGDTSPARRAAARAGESAATADGGPASSDTEAGASRDGEPSGTADRSPSAAEPDAGRVIDNPMADLDPREAMDRAAAALSEQLGATEVTE